MTGTRAMPQNMMHGADWLHSLEPALTWLKGLAMVVLAPAAVWFLGRRAQRVKEKLDTRTADQKSIDQLATRMTKLEDRVETLTNEKFALELKVISLQTEIGRMEVLKAEYMSRDTMSQVQIHALEIRLAGKEDELLCTKKDLEDVKEREAALLKAAKDVEDSTLHVSVTSGDQK